MSLRRRLTTLYLLLLLATLLVVGVGLYWAERRILLKGVENDLQQAADVIEDDFQAQNQSFAISFNGVLKTLGQDFSGSPIAVLILNEKLEEYSFSDNQQISASFLKDEAAARRALLGIPTLSYPKINGTQLMALTRPLRYSGRPTAVLVVAQSLDNVYRALDALILVLCLGGGLMLLAMGLMVSYITRRGLQPIHAIASTAEQIVRAEDLSRRIPDPGQRDELGRLVAIVNDLLARLDLLFNAQRRLIADVSHELRTPLAAMRGNLEILRRGAVRDPGLLNETLGDMEREAARLTRLVNDLLLLARSESGVSIRREPVELDTLLLEVFREMRLLADGVSLRLGAEDQATIIGDRDRLKQALLNLTHNALRFTPAGGEVRLELEHCAGEVRLSVIDTGVGIPAETLPHIFERFYRIERSRARDVGGAGLGLAIVKWVAEAHAGRVEVESELGKGSRFTIVLPMIARFAGRPLASAEPISIS